MADNRLYFLGTYVPKDLHSKFRIKCFLNGTSLSKELLALIMLDTKNIDLAKYEVVSKTIELKDEKNGTDSKT